MPKERYHRVRITTADDNVVLDHLELFEKRLNERLKTMEQEIRDLRSLIQSSRKQQVHPSDVSSESNLPVFKSMRKHPIVIPAEPIGIDDQLTVEINDAEEDDQESDCLQEDEKEERSTTKDYVLDETLRTVTDVVREWSQGVAPGIAPLKELGGELNQNWCFKTIKQRELFYEREIIYSEVRFIAQARHISEDEAAAALETHRSREGYSLKTLVRLIKSHQRRREREQIDQTPYI